MFTVVVTSPYRPVPSVYACSTLSFARTMAQASYGERCFIYDDKQRLIEQGNGDKATVETLHIIVKS